MNITHNCRILGDFWGNIIYERYIKKVGIVEQHDRGIFTFESKYLLTTETRDSRLNSISRVSCENTRSPEELISSCNWNANRSRIIRSWITRLLYVS